MYHKRVTTLHSPTTVAACPVKSIVMLPLLVPRQVTLLPKDFAAPFLGALPPARAAVDDFFVVVEALFGGERFGAGGPLAIPAALLLVHNNAVAEDIRLRRELLVAADLTTLPARLLLRFDVHRAIWCCVEW